MKAPADRYLRAALKYASLGWPVLPLWPRKKNPLDRLVPNGAVNASTDERQIREWWRASPSANVGLTCERLLIVDIDPRNDGPAGLAELTARYGPLPPCPTVMTGSRGSHYFFALPQGDLRGKLKIGTGPDGKDEFARGVDIVHGRNRYVVAAPSLHPDGLRYSWTSPRGLPLLEPPAWIVELATRPPSPPLPPRTSGPDALERARRYLAKCDPAVSGAGGHNRAFAVCAAVAEKFDVSADEALALLLEDWNQRCEPPWTEAQLRHKLKGAFSRT